MDRKIVETLLSTFMLTSADKALQNSGIKAIRIGGGVDAELSGLRGLRGAVTKHASLEPLGWFRRKSAFILPKSSGSADLTFA